MSDEQETRPEVLAAWKAVGIAQVNAVKRVCGDQVENVSWADVDAAIRLLVRVASRPAAPSPSRAPRESHERPSDEEILAVLYACAAAIDHEENAVAASERAKEAIAIARRLEDCAPSRAEGAEPYCWVFVHEKSGGRSIVWNAPGQFHDIRKLRADPSLTEVALYERSVSAARAEGSGTPEPGENAEGLSVICGDCGALVSGVEAGNRVRWVVCSVCRVAARDEAASPSGSGRGTEPEKMFPIQRGQDIPWSVIAPWEKQAQRNHDQTLERLAKRGGLDAREALHVMLCLEWERTPASKEIMALSVLDANLRLMALVKERLAASLVVAESGRDAEAITAVSLLHGCGDTIEHDTGAPIDEPNCVECGSAWPCPTLRIIDAAKAGETDFEKLYKTAYGPDVVKRADTHA